MSLWLTTLSLIPKESAVIDAHIHYGDDSPEFLALLAEFDLKLLNISFVHGPDDP